MMILQPPQTFTNGKRRRRADTEAVHLRNSQGAGQLHRRKREMSGGVGMETRQRMLSAAADRDYNSALDEMDRLDALSAADFVLKGQWILLSSGADGRSPEDARRAFDSALALDQNYVPAILELAWFEHLVMDN